MRQVAGGGAFPKLGRVFRVSVVACFIACEPGEPVDPGFQPRDTPCISTCLPQRRSGAVPPPKLLQDQYANYVVQTALTVSKPPQLTHLRPGPRRSPIPSKAVEPPGCAFLHLHFVHMRDSVGSLWQPRPQQPRVNAQQRKKESILLGPKGGGGAFFPDSLFSDGAPDRTPHSHAPDVP